MTETTDVIEFRKAFGLPIHETPTRLTYEKPGLVRWFKRVILRKPITEAELHLNLIQEEFDELTSALADRDLQEVFDALIDLKYVITGMGVHMGLPMDEGWKEVQLSNMSKLDENGEPMYHDGSEGPVGKVKKSPSFREPRLDVILEAASE